MPVFVNSFCNQKIMTLTPDEYFIRRFLLHILPERYVRICHFGLLANRNRKDNIAACHKMSGGENVTKEIKVGRLGRNRC